VAFDGSPNRTPTSRDGEALLPADWGENWREHFGVDRINGFLGNELKFENQKLVGNYLRMGYDPNGSWRIYKLRPDFNPADKVQVEDDITASVVLPSEKPGISGRRVSQRERQAGQQLRKLLFQRPDDAIHRGFDKDAERDLSLPGTFLSNFEPLGAEQAQAGLLITWWSLTSTPNR
jgi:hypothetical protein